MTELSIFAAQEESDDDNLPVPQLDTPPDLRPDLADLGLVEAERGVCEDTYENRAVLRRHRYSWTRVYDQHGSPTTLIAAQSPEQQEQARVLSLSQKRALLSDQNNLNSDYLVGLELVLEEQAARLVPGWVLKATRDWQARENRPADKRGRPLYLPARCLHVKADGLRCQLWSSGRPKDDGLCRQHLGRLARKPGESVERARQKVIQSAPYAVDVLEQLMETAVSEPVKLKAASEILDRAGIKGGLQVDINATVNDGRDAVDVVMEKLQRLYNGASSDEERREILWVMTGRPVVETIDSTDTSDDKTHPTTEEERPAE